MALQKARWVHPGGVLAYRQQYVRCGKAGCRRCPPQGLGHGPYWYGYYWDYRQRTKSFYVGKRLPTGAVVIGEGASPANDELPAAPTPQEGGATPTTP